MKILVINTGSSSIKYQLFEMQDQSVLASGVVEKIGEVNSVITHKNQQKALDPKIIDQPIADHRVGMERIVELLLDEKSGVISDLAEVSAVGHRVVHGGETFSAPTKIDSEVLAAIKKNIPLAPLHNPANVVGIEVAQSIFPSAQQVAVFDTAFHHSIPAEAFMYAIPYKLYETLKIRRYGFHGTSHAYISETAAKYLGKDINQTNLITIHLGNGGSIAAVKNGKSIDTSMGMTPLEGLIMGTRSGDIDPAIPYFITQNADKDITDVDSILNKQSGLKGICGNNDMRDILAACETGDEKARLAVDMYVYRIKKYIGSYFAILGQIDAIVFTAGIGEHSKEIREKVCSGLESLGIEIDLAKNKERKSGNRELNTKSSEVKILLIPTNEELKIAIETATLVA